jgi:hypothetical protein
VAQVGANRPVVEAQGLVELTYVEVTQRAMPPVVHFEENVVPSLIGAPRPHPTDTVLRAPLHLQDMRHSVVGPGIERCQIGGSSACLCRSGIVTG